MNIDKVAKALLQDHNCKSCKNDMFQGQCKTIMIIENTSISETVGNIIHLTNKLLYNTCEKWTTNPYATGGIIVHPNMSDLMANTIITLNGSPLNSDEIRIENIKGV